MTNNRLTSKNSAKTNAEEPGAAVPSSSGAPAKTSRTPEKISSTPAKTSRTPEKISSTHNATPNKPSCERNAAHALVFAVLCAAFVVVFICSLGLGTYHIAPLDVVVLIAGLPTSESLQDASMAHSLIWDVRIPRVCAAALIGAGLSCAGAVFQGLFRNPLASPYTLGVSNGAGFGAALAIVLSANALGIQLTSIACGLVAVLLTFLIAAQGKKSTVTLILSGMLIGSLFASLVALLKFCADPTEKLPQIVYWLMGSLSGITSTSLLSILPFYCICLLLILLSRWRINVLSMGDTTAASFGIHVARERGIIICAASVLTALLVSIAGIIGWIGIVVPHLSRMLMGPNFKQLIPTSCVLGGAYLIIIDDICRCATALEIPLGVITGIVGVPLFLYFIRKKKVDW